jgi:hypothetical protein
MANRGLGHKSHVNDMVFYRHQHGGRRYMHSGTVIERSTQGNKVNIQVRCIQADYPNEKCRGEIHKFEFIVGGED